MEPRKRSYYNCSVFGCLNSTLNSELSFFRAPAALESRITWLKLIGREDLIDSACLRTRVCETHFTPDSIRVSLQRKHLIKNSIPQLLLPVKPLPDNLANKLVQTCIETADKSLQCDFNFQKNDQVDTPFDISDDTPRKRKLLNEIQIRRKKRKMSEAYMFHDLCDKFLTKNLAQIVKQQTKNKTYGAGSRFSLEYKIFCLNLYYTSPQAYNLLKDTLCLPSKLTLTKMNTHVTTKIDNYVMDILKTKLQYISDVDRNCALVVGAISLKVNLFYNIREDKIYGFHEVDGAQSPEPAKYAIVAMIHGLFENYKMPVGFALTAECKHYQSVSDWIDKLIKKLFSIGINVRILVTDMASHFTDSARNRLVSIERPYFFVEDRKIYYIFDPHHLIKLVRNNLMTYDFYFENNVAKWHHIIQFYEMDKVKRLKLAPELTESHIKPTKLEKMKVKYAVEVFSGTVAAGLSSYRDFGMIEKSAEGTIKLIELMNDLHIFLNTASRCGRTQYQNAFCGEEYQISFVNDMLNFFASLKLINPKNDENVTTKVKFIEGFQITLKSLLLVLEDLRIEGYSYIPTRQLNQECLEDIFCKVKRYKKGTRNKNSTEPTCWQLVSAMRKIFLINVLNSFKSDNCEENLAKCLLDEEKIYGKSIKQEIISNNENEKNSAKCSLKGENLHGVSIKEELDMGTLLVSNREENEHYAAKCSVEVENVYGTSIKEERDYDTWMVSKGVENEDKCSLEGENLCDTSIKQEYDLETWIVVSSIEENENNAESNSIPSISTTDYNTLDLPENNALVFISGYLLQKCLDHHTECDEFLAYIERDDNLENFSDDTRFTHYKDYIKDGTKTVSIIPPDSFVEFVRSLEERFCKLFESNYLNGLILNSILDDIQIITFPMPCKCFPLAYCKKLFIRMRIYYLLKFNNRTYRQSRNRQQLFSVKKL